MSMTGDSMMQDQPATVSLGETVDQPTASPGVEGQHPIDTAKDFIIPQKDKRDHADPDLIREQAQVKQWTARIKDDRKKAEGAFKTMRADIRFARGLQWNGQKDLDDARYVCNLVLKSLNNGVSLLYAKNPECESFRRDRLDFELWDGKMESLIQAQTAFTQAVTTGQPPNPLAIQLLQDYSQGEMWRDLVDRVGKTVRFTFQYMMDSLQPSFKIQMKQLVRRVKTTGVGYVKINFDDGFNQSLSTSETESTIVDRTKRMKHIAAKFLRDELTAESPELDIFAQLGNSIEESVKSGDTKNINQRITFDFLPATSVIVDSNCRQLKGFVGAHHMAIEFVYDLDYVNAYFEADIKGDDIKAYNPKGGEQMSSSMDNSASTSAEDPKKKKCCVWEVYDLDSKTMFYIVDGYKLFLQKPQPAIPDLNHFFPVIALTFNDVETDPGEEEECQFYPPSDVTLMRSPQKEWNRTREALRSHRIANTPCYMTGKGWMTPDDKDKINNHEDSAVIELEGAQIGTDVSRLLASFPHTPINPQLYDTTPLSQDIQYSSGSQEADLGRPSPKVTATGATIAEQAKNSVAASNIDDLDDFLSELAEMGGEIIMRYFNIDTVKRVAGRGAVLPQQEREDFLNEIMLTVKAASSGRPNKAINVSTFQQIAPLLIQAGANPVGVVTEGVRVLDDRLDISKFFPIVPPEQKLAMSATGQNPQPGQDAGQQPKQQKQRYEELPNQAPVLATEGRQLYGK